MRGRWAAGIVPRNFSWVITDHLAVAERPGGSAPQHRRVRRREEILWLRAQGFTKVVSLLPSSHNLHAYEELDVPYEHVPMGLHDDPTKSLADLYPALLAWLYGGERILIHQDELSERLAGVLAGFLWWSGMLREAPLAISAIEQLLRRQLGSIGRTIVTLAVDVPPPTEADLRRPERAAAARLVATRLRELEEARSAEAELAGDLLLLRADAVEAERAKSHDAASARPAKRAARDEARPEDKRPKKAPSKARPSAKVSRASTTRPAPRVPKAPPAKAKAKRAPANAKKAAPRAKVAKTVRSAASKAAPRRAAKTTVRATARRAVVTKRATTKAKRPGRNGAR